jgi:carbohydrate diacid regulator
MFIDIKLAGEIMREINNVVPNYCSIMDDKGKILTCTNPSRIGTVHEGTKIILENNLDELIVERDGLYPDCLMGVVLSIRFTSEIIGFFGIAGDPDEILNFGRIIQKMIRMIIYEKLDASYKERNINAKRILIESLIKGDTDGDYPFNIEEMMSQYGLNKLGPYAVALIKYSSEENAGQSTEFTEIKHNIILNDLISQLEERSSLAAYVRNYCVVISNLTSQKLHNILVGLFNNIHFQFGLSLLCTIGDTIKNYSEISKSYNEALSMIHFKESQNKNSEGIYFYNPINLDFIIGNISECHRRNLSSSVFAGCDDKEVPSFKDFIIAYFKCNGSLNHMSQEYYIHKNTVQYKIQKIQSKTGLDVRVANDLFILYMASID